MKKLTAVVLGLSFFCVTSGQYFKWNTGFHGFFDNREYFNKFIEPQTIFGSRLYADAGFMVNENNRFRAGFNYLYEFGSKGDLIAPDITMFYHGFTKHVNFYIGAFPRHDLVTHPFVLLTDTLEYFRPNVEGMYLGFKTGWAYHNIWIDWTSRQTDSRRETFLIGGEGMLRKGILFYQHNFIMYHFAGPAIPIPGDHIRDNGGITLSVGVDLSSQMFLDSMTVKTGAVFSYDRIRHEYDFKYPLGTINNLLLMYKNFGVMGTYYYGNSQILLYGDGFYKSKNYGRIDLFYMNNKSALMNGKLQFSFHIIPGNIDYSQSFVIRVNLDGRKKINRKTD
jgi:hypothetical protein